MTHSIKTLTSIFTVLVVTAFAAQSNADEYHHIDQLALKIQRTTKRLMKETVHYRHTAEYGHLLSDSQALYRLATHIHDVTHFEGNLRHLQSDVSDLDRTFHHVEGVFDRIEHDAAFGDGHVHGNTKHVKRLLDTIEDSIHHLKADLQTIQNRNAIPINRYERPVYRQPTPVYRQPTQRPVWNSGYGTHGNGHGYTQQRNSYGWGHGSRSSGFGFSIGGGSSRISFNF